jgi:hypothetical protein
MNIGAEVTAEVLQVSPRVFTFSIRRVEGTAPQVTASRRRTARRVRIVYNQPVLVLPVPGAIRTGGVVDARAVAGDRVEWTDDDGRGTP